MENANRLEVLVALHNDSLNTLVCRMLKRKGYMPVPAPTMEYVVKELGMNCNLNTVAIDCRYSIVIMDANLGEPATNNIGPVERVYRYLRPLIAGGHVNFMTASGNDNVVGKAKCAGIPCVNKPEGLSDYIVGIPNASP